MLEEVNPILRIERHNRLFPIFGVPVTESASPRLAFPVLGPHINNFHIKQLFHGPADILFICEPIDLKGIGIES